MKDDAPDWGNLKAAWQNSVPIPVDALRGSLRWRIWGSRAWFALEVLSFIYIGLVVVQNLLIGRIAQGAGLGVVVALCLALSVWARRARLVGGMDSVPGMVEHALSRARKSLRITQATYAVIAITLIAAFLDGLPTPWTNDRFLLRLVLLGMFTAATVVYHVYTRVRLRRLSDIRGLLNREQS
jgi:hypothetical protein